MSRPHHRCFQILATLTTKPGQGMKAKLQILSLPVRHGQPKPDAPWW
jgi:hypothetical protein